MKSEIPRSATQAMRSVVVVFDKDITGAYCTGFVAAANTGTSPAATLVVAPRGFVSGRSHVRVCFFDGVRSRAREVAKNEEFSLLTTKLHTSCEKVNWVESGSSLVTPSPSFVLAAGSPSHIYYQPSFTMVESIQSYLLKNYTRLAAQSENYFLVSCEEAIELSTAPVFTTGSGSTKSIAMGVVLTDCRSGSEIKVAVTAAHFKQMLEALVGPAPPPSRGGSVGKRKRRRKPGQKAD